MSDVRVLVPQLCMLMQSPAWCYRCVRFCSRRDSVLPLCEPMQSPAFGAFVVCVDAVASYCCVNRCSRQYSPSDTVR